METETTALVSAAPTNIEAFSTSPSQEAPIFSLSTIENSSPVLENQLTLFKPEAQPEAPEYPDYIDAEIVELAEGDPKPPVIEIFIPGEEEVVEPPAQEAETDKEEVKEPEKAKKVEKHEVRAEHVKQERPEERENKDDEEKQKKEQQKQEALNAEIETKTEEGRKLAEAELERRVKQIEYLLLEKYGYEQSVTLAGITSFVAEAIIEESESDAMPYVEVYTLFEAKITVLTKDGAIQLDGKLKGAGSSIKAVSYTEVQKTGTVIAEFGSKKLLEEKERIFAWALAKNAFKKAMAEYVSNPMGEQGISLLAKAEEASRQVDTIEHQQIASEVKQQPHIPWKGIIDFLAMTMSHSSGGSDASGAMDMAA